VLVAGSSAGAATVSKRTTAHAQSDVEHLLRLMDRDKNGTVSKEEYMQFMSQTYDSLDSEKTGQLASRHLQPLSAPNYLKCHGLAVERGLAVNERGRTDTGISAWGDFMRDCMAGKIH
jgi:hypothetical protein